LEKPVEHLHGVDVVATKVEISEGWQLGKLFLHLFDLVSAQVQRLELWERLPAGKGGHRIRFHVELFKVWHVLKRSKRLEFVVNGTNDSKVCVTSPSLIHFLHLVMADVEVFKLGALECGNLLDFIVRHIKPFEVREGLIIREDTHTFDLVIGHVESDKP